MCGDVVNTVYEGGDWAVLIVCAGMMNGPVLFSVLLVLDAECCAVGLQEEVYRGSVWDDYLVFPEGNIADA